MNKSKALVMATASLLIATFSTVTVNADNGMAKLPGQYSSSQKSRAADFWTADRIKKADVFEMVFQDGAKVGKRVVLAKGAGKPGGGTGSPSVMGSSWTKGGFPLTASGKVFFAIGASYYQCSGALVRDGSALKSILLTAGHCVYDNISQSYVTNLIFIPSYDTNLVEISGCAASLNCWSAKSLEANVGFTSQVSFTTQATLFDWGFVTIDELNGGLLPDGGDPTLNSDGANSFPIIFTSLHSTTSVSSFGYPVVSPYSGKDLVYSSGPISFDVKTGNQTYSLASNMTGGCSGGPWLSLISAITPYSGTLSSVNSYKYGTTKFIYGPKFNNFTQASYNAALAK